MSRSTLIRRGILVSWLTGAALLLAADANEAEAQAKGGKQGHAQKRGVHGGAHAAAQAIQRGACGCGQQAGLQGPQWAALIQQLQANLHQHGQGCGKQAQGNAPQHGKGKGGGGQQHGKGKGGGQQHGQGKGGHHAHGGGAQQPALVIIMLPNGARLPLGMAGQHVCIHDINLKLQAAPKQLHKAHAGAMVGAGIARAQPAMAPMLMLPAPKAVQAPKVKGKG